MARLLISNKNNGSYEYSFEPIVESNISKAVLKFLKRFGYIRRIRINPCDSRTRALVLALFKDKEKRLEFEEECCKKIFEEKTGLFIVDESEAIALIKDMLGKVMERYGECKKKYKEMEKI